MGTVGSMGTLEDIGVNGDIMGPLWAIEDMGTLEDIGEHWGILGDTEGILGVIGGY